MKWIKVDRARRVQPGKGEYGDWKEQIAAECDYQCVYCALHERQFGGRRYAHIDHFRPKSRAEYGKLSNVIQNLYYSCAVCNCFKSDDWPSEPTADHSVEAFIDPSEHDFNEIFEMSAEFEVSSTYLAGAYVVEKLFLNRPHLLAERYLFDTLRNMNALLDKLDAYYLQLFDVGDQGARKLAVELVRMARSLRESADVLRKSIVYHGEDQKRKK